MNICPDCGKELKHICYDYLEGWGESEYSYECDCGYSFHFAYGTYEIHHECLDILAQLGE